MKRTPYSISYTELWVAKSHNLEVGRVRNRHGRYVEASPASIAAAAQSASGHIGDDVRSSITNTEGPDDYPMASFTWIVVPNNFGDSEKRNVMVSFLKWVLTAGQASLDSAAHLASLPHLIADREIKVIDSLH